MKEKGRIDSREMNNPVVMMDFPLEIRIKVEELADKFTDISGVELDFPQVVLICIDYVHSLIDCDMKLIPVEGGDE